MKRNANRHLIRLARLILLITWAGVTIAAFGFHHHDAGEGCDDSCCPFVLVVLNFPFLVMVCLFIFPPEADFFRPAGPSTAPEMRPMGAVSVRGPPAPSFT
ncbi:MAG: hypothetical protein BWX80_04164 [Candidatus Hydrogenedentes bacterium ADurb.Bin101]|jgi:hypothetical protein|nr:hypothetical protein [Candidatus Hydrogenedentota bacterium]OQB96724.1 MAG: hypothetical protein BWX80_04164 [Candidatus Hydrogenedentes bacterium ADurb.Bin101]HOC70982.1 hypothetical protein [Candidatus Hydrogenedentota bacterium]